MNGLKCLIVFIGVQLLGVVGYTQSYDFKHYTVEDGLAQNQILDLYQDHRGYLWFGTNLGGVSIFDGNNFHTLTDSDGLPSNVVFSIAEDKKGRKYFGTNGGLGVWNGDSIRSYTTQNGLKHNRVFNVFYDSQDRLWVGSQIGVYHFVNDSIVPFEMDTNLSKHPIFSIYEDSKGGIWFGSVMGGLFHFDGAKIKQYTTEDGLLHDFVKTVVEDENGVMWIGTLKGFNILGEDGVLQEKRISENIPVLTINSSAKDIDGVLWFGTESGLVKYHKGEFKWFLVENGISNLKVYTVLNDDEGNLWLGTNGKGASKLNYHGEVFVNYNVIHGLANDIVTSIYQDSLGTVWIGSDKGITEFRNDEFTVYERDDNGMKMPIAGEARDIIETKKGELWVATKSAGLWHRKNEKFTNINLQDGLISNTCYAVLLDSQKRLWLGSNKGLMWSDDGITFNVLDDVSGNSIWSLMEDDQNRIWFTTDHGACVYDGSSIQYFDKKDGFIDGRVRNVVRDVQGNFWFATNKGLYRYDGKTFNHINDQNGLISNTIYSVLVAKTGLLWIGTQKGIQSIDLAAYNQNNEFVSKSYSKEDGFIGVECNSNAIMEDNLGRIWFGTVQGVTIFDPKLSVINEKEPKTHVTNIRFEFEDYDWSTYSSGMENGLAKDLVLPYKKNHLSFDFVGISYRASDNVKYQFKLAPLDEEWLNWTDKMEAVYPHIPPGEYTFMVRAKNKDGIINTKPTTYTFVILPPWYKTWWFYTLCVVSFFSSIYSIFVVRTKQLKQQKETLEREVSERTKELVKEKEKVEKINEEVLHKNEIIEEKNTEIMDSIEYAKGIQQAILPSREKVKKYLPESFILFRPKDVVSGDFYWMDHKENISFFTAADCTGHGVPGAFVSMVGANGLNRAVNGFGLREPGSILDRLRDLVQETFKARKDGMDVGLCGLHHDTNKLQFAGAHNPLWVIRSSGNKLLVDGKEIEPNLELEQNLFEVKADKQPVGAFDHATPFTNHEVQLQQGDSLYVFTDGYPDQFGGAKGKKFMSKSLKKLLISIYDRPMEEQRNILEETIVSWMDVSNNEQIDDICIFGVRI